MKIKIELILPQPPPPRHDVVITLTVEDAKALKAELYSLKQSEVTPHYTVNRLINALANSRVQDYAP